MTNSDPYSDPPLSVSLSERERDVLTLLAQDLTDRQIADQLVIATTTVKWYNRQLFNKLGVESRRQAVERATALGLLGEVHAVATLKSALPVPPTTFIGREEETAQIVRLLSSPSCRLLTLVGPGGIGKTRLALQAASEQQEHFAQGICFVPLTGVGSSELLPTAIAHALQYRFSGADNPRAQIVNFLREKQILLLMDNFEHLLEGADLLTEILRTCTGVKSLVTSRERLNVQEEWVLALDGLSFPPDETPGASEHYSAIQLFVQRAQQTHPGFSLDEHLEAVTRICQQVEGMPLALELAASWLRVMSCRQIAVQITSSPDLLTTRLRNLPERHRSLRAVFEQSWNLLTPTEQAVMTQLSIFRGGFDLEAAEQVAGASLPLLANLVDKSLIRLNGDERYDLHELLRQYAAEKLPTEDARAAAANHHFEYFFRLAEEAETHTFGGEQVAWFDRLETERDNLWVALAWSLNTEPGLRLAASLGWFYEVRSHWREGLDWLERALAANPNAPASLRAKALRHTGICAHFSRDARAARRWTGQALELARAVDDRWNIAWALADVGMFYEGAEDLARAAQTLEKSLTLFRQLDDPMGLNHVLRRSAYIAITQENYPYAHVLLEEALEGIYAVNDITALHHVLLYQADIAVRERNDWQELIRLNEQALALIPEIHDGAQARYALHNLADAEMSLGNYARAFARFQEALVVLRDYVPHSQRVSLALAGIAKIMRANGQLERAGILLGASDSGVNFVLHDPSFTLDSTVKTYHHEITALRDQLGETAFVQAWAAGKAMTNAQAIRFGLECEFPPTTPLSPTAPRDGTASQPAPDRLTARELEVLRLIAEGLSNAEIGQRLFLTTGTIKAHTRRIYGKLGVNSRTQAVAQAQQLDLL